MDKFVSLNEVINDGDLDFMSGGAFKSGGTLMKDYIYKDTHHMVRKPSNESEYINFREGLANGKIIDLNCPMGPGDYPAKLD